MSRLKLFINLCVSDIFHFYDTPNRKLIKSDSDHYVGPGGRRRISRTVAIFKDEPESSGKPIKNSKGDCSEG